MLLHRGQMELIYDAPLKETEKWAVFPVHDGEHVVVIPREDILLGNTSRKEMHRVTPLEKPPRAMLFTDRNYVVVDLRTGKQSLEEGKTVIETMHLPDPETRVALLSNLESNIQRNTGNRRLLPGPEKGIREATRNEVLLFDLEGNTRKETGNKPLLFDPTGRRRDTPWKRWKNLPGYPTKP